MKKPLLLFLLFTISICAFGQKPKFKKVSKEELLQNSSTIDSTADAEFLYRGCQLKYTYNNSRERFELVYEYHLRIKVYNEDGKAYADHSFPFYTGKDNASSEKVKNIEAYTFNLINDKVEKTKLNKKSIFEEESNAFYSVKKIAMPEVQAGSVLDIKYRLVSPYYYRVDEFYFQMNIPVRFAEFKVESPEYFNYNYNSKGLVPLKVDQEKGNDKLTITYVVDNSKDKYSVIKERRTQAVDFSTDKRHYYASNIPPVSNEPYVYTMSNYKSSLKMELLFTNFPSSPAKYYTTTWDEIAKTLSENGKFGGQLSKTYKEFNELIDGVQDKPLEEKILTIYSEVQNRYTWNGQSSESSEKGIKKMLEEGTGNSADINLLLVNLLQRANVNAYPLVSRKSTSGFLNISNPSLADLDYVVAGVMMEEGSIMYLDATNKNLAPNMLPFRALNLKNVLISGESAKEMPILNPNKGNESRVYDLTTEGRSLKGTIKESIKGYSAYSMRNKYATTAELEEGLQTESITMTDLEISQYNQKYKPIKIQGNISLDGYVQEIDDKLFIDLNIGDEEFVNPFTSESREFALFFSAKKGNTDIIKITIPEGYQVESLPEALNIATPEMIFKYLIKADVNGNQIILTRRNSLNQTIVTPAYYEPIKSLFDQVEAKMKEKIVLAKM